MIDVQRLAQEPPTAAPFSASSTGQPGTASAGFDSRVALNRCTRPAAAGGAERPRGEGHVRAPRLGAAATGP